MLDTRPLPGEAPGMNDMVRNPVNLAMARSTDDRLSALEQNILAINEFSASPRHIGIGRFNENLRNMIVLMEELSDNDTGWLYEAVGDHEMTENYTLTRGKSRKKKKKNRDTRADQLLLELEEQMMRSFDRVHSFVHEKLHVVKTNIDLEISKLEEQIESAEVQADDALLAKKQKKRKRLRLFKERVHKHHDRLEDAASTAAVVEVMQDLHADQEAFNSRGAFPPTQEPVSRIDFSFLRTIFGRLRRNDAPEAGSDQAYDAHASTGETGGSGDSGDQGGGAGDYFDAPGADD